MSRPIDPRRIEVVDDQIAEILRRKGGAASVEMVASAWRFMRDALRAQVSSRHPEWHNQQIEAEVSRRLACGST